MIDESSADQASGPAAPAPSARAAAPLRPEDFYLENGRLVFTAAYHLRRGYCCGSGCRHCPYPPSSSA